MYLSIINWATNTWLNENNKKHFLCSALSYLADHYITRSEELRDLNFYGTFFRKSYKWPPLPILTKTVPTWLSDPIIQMVLLYIIFKCEPSHKLMKAIKTRIQKTPKFTKWRTLQIRMTRHRDRFSWPFRAYFIWSIRDAVRYASARRGTRTVTSTRTRGYLNISWMLIRICRLFVVNKRRPEALALLWKGNMW